MEGVKFDIGKRYQGLLSLMRNENLKRIKEIAIAFKLMLIVRRIHFHFKLLLKLMYLPFFKQNCHQIFIRLIQLIKFQSNLLF